MEIILKLFTITVRSFRFTLLSICYMIHTLLLLSNKYKIKIKQNSLNRFSIPILRNIYRIWNTHTHTSTLAHYSRMNMNHWFPFIWFYVGKNGHKNWKETLKLGNEKIIKSEAVLWCERKRIHENEAAKLWKKFYLNILNDKLIGRCC